MSGAPLLNPELSQKLTIMTRALERAGVPYAVGGAVVLIYCSEPRGTVDLDINIFLDSHEPDEALLALQAGGVDLDVESVSARVRRDGQVRIWYEQSAVDLFFANTEFHAQSGKRARRVTFEGVEISLLSCEDLVIYKAMFNRPKDWIDIEQLLYIQGTHFDLEYTRGWLVAMVGEEEERVRKLDALATEVAAAEAAEGEAFGDGS